MNHLNYKEHSTIMRLDELAQLLTENNYAVTQVYGIPQWVGFFHNRVLCISIGDADIDCDYRLVRFTCDKGGWDCDEDLAKAITTFYVSKGIFPYLRERGNDLCMTLSIIEQ